MELQIAQNGYQEIQLQDEASKLDIVVDKHINASLMITYSGIEATSMVTLVLQEGSSLTIMLKNDMQGKLKLCVSGTILRDASLKVAYCDIENAESEVESSFQLKEVGATADIRSACIVSQRKHYTMTCEHLVPYTKAEMEHYAVIQEFGDYRMEACGKIDKGAHDSASHQKTRVLTMSENQLSEVVPLLLIDENDVKASHATTLGQPDENQLYYLQTRGLSRGQALGLLSVGYIMPITEVFDDDAYNAKLKNEIEMKVGLHA